METAVSNAEEDAKMEDSAKYMEDNSDAVFLCLSAF